MPSIEWGKLSKLSILLPTVRLISNPPPARPGIGGLQIWLAQIYLSIHVVRALQYVNKKTPSVAMHFYRFYIKVISGNLGVFTQTWTSIVLIVIYCVVIDFLVSFRKAALSADWKLRTKSFDIESWYCALILQVGSFLVTV